MTPEQKKEFDASIEALKLPEQPAPDDVTPIAQQVDEQVDEISVELPEIEMPAEAGPATVPPIPSPIADIQAAFADGAGQVAAEQPKGDDWFATAVREQQQNVDVREAKEVDPAHQPKGDPDLTDQQNQDLFGFIDQQGRNGNLNEDGAVKDWNQINGAQAKPEDIDVKANEAVQQVAKEVRGLGVEVVETLRLMATEIGTLKTEVQQIRKGLMRRRG